MVWRVGLAAIAWRLRGQSGCLRLGVEGMRCQVFSCFGQALRDVGRLQLPGHQKRLKQGLKTSNSKQSPKSYHLSYIWCPGRHMQVT